MTKDLYICMPVGEFYGYAVCGRNLLKELSKKANVGYLMYGTNALMTEETAGLIEKHIVPAAKHMDGPVVHVVADDMKPKTKARGTINAAYLFHEYQLSEEQIKNLRDNFDILIAGSSWLERRLRGYGFKDVVYIPQGVDRSIFKPNHEDFYKDMFVVFSAGKYEHRKAQDLVIKILKMFHDKHSDVCLMMNWNNPWSGTRPEEFADMARAEGIGNICSLPFMPHPYMARSMNRSHVGLFPNRIEGGTNLCLMEYLSCGLPAVVNTSTGQADVVSPKCAFMFDGKDDNGIVETSLNYLEWVYKNTSVLEAKGKSADKWMDNFTWEKSAERFLEVLCGKKTEQLAPA